ncbi:hypothetical protein Tco_1033040 [Tanacetum coccineum]|uniref:Uncharacterized protein n=1 Tax=Tanacetum coccineum TaxID=301880 RepID=A0ABQ5GEC1_9ASTR
MVKTGLVEAIDSLVPLDERFATFQVLRRFWKRISHKRTKNKATNDKTKHGMEKVRKSTQTKSKGLSMEKIQLEG